MRNEYFNGGPNSSKYLDRRKRFYTSTRLAEVAIADYVFAKTTRNRGYVRTAHSHTFYYFFMTLFKVFREENNSGTDLTISVRDHICQTIRTHLGNIFYGREQILSKICTVGHAGDNIII